MENFNILEQLVWQDCLDQEYRIQVLEVLGKLKNEYQPLRDHEEKCQEWEERILIKIRKNKDLNSQLYCYSYMFYTTKHSQWMEAILDVFSALSEDELSWKRRYQIFEQILHQLFCDYSLQTVDNREKLAKIYSDIVKHAKAGMMSGVRMIPAAIRNKNLVVVITGQFLGMAYAPTKTALDRCSTLIRKRNKQVLLINTAEVLCPLDWMTPWCGIGVGSYDESLLSWDSIEYEDLNIPFFQCENNMPNEKTMLEIIQVIQKLKPLYIVNIGNGNLLAELCSEIIPTITVSLVFSSLSMTAGQLQVIGRKLQSEDMTVLKALGKEAEHVIEGKFTFSLPIQKFEIPREEICQEEAFLCAVVGGRLNTEITDDFVDMMLSISNDKIKFVFIGSFDVGYERYVQKDKRFKEKAILVGFVDNILGYLEHCDLYVNPIRRGGGASVIEAMNEGLPAVTTDLGDVAVSAGEEFYVKDYVEMAREIEHYYEDRQYYVEKSNKAKLRAAEMLDTDQAFCEILDEAERRLGIK